MAQTTDVPRSFHLQLLPLKAVPHQIINVELMSYTHQQQTLYQQSLVSLGAETELPATTDDKDVTIAVLEGCGNLTLNQDVVTLDLGVFVFIPAYTSYSLQTQTYLTLLLNHSEPDPSLHESSWLINL